jgi:ABC-type multidrug transport system fused ATPase/permease subunit
VPEGRLTAAAADRKVVADTRELILDPFFDHGGIDKGLFWHFSASLQRVAIGYSLAAVVGVALGTLVGQSVWAMRGLDPIFQVLRTIPPLAWLPLSLAAFRDGQPSAIFVIFITSIWPIIINTAVGIRNIPQDYRNVAAVVQLNPLEFFAKIMIPAPRPTSSRPAHRHRPVVARDHRGRNADRRRRHRLLHLGRLEFLAHQRNHPGAFLCRHHRLRARPLIALLAHHRHPRHCGQLREHQSCRPISSSTTSTRPSHAARPTEVLKDINLTIAQGEYVSIIGHSGCGKSTLLNIVAGSRRHPWRRVAGRSGGEFAGARPRRRVPEPQPAAVAHGLRQRSARRRQGFRQEQEQGPSAMPG